MMAYEYFGSSSPLPRGHFAPAFAKEDTPRQPIYSQVASPPRVVGMGERTHISTILLVSLLLIGTAGLLTSSMASADMRSGRESPASSSVRVGSQPPGALQAGSDQIAWLRQF